MLDEKKSFHVSQIHGIPVNISNPEQALSEVDYLIQIRQHHYVCFFEGNLFFRALFEDDVKQVISSASLIYPDGIAVAKELKWKLKKNVSRISGPSFLLRACEYGIERNWKHFFLGGDTSVPEKLAQNLQAKYSGLKVVGTYSPPFRDLSVDEEIELKKMIEDSQADLLWVGLGGPKQEFWMKKHLNMIDVPVMLGIGAAFDFHSGNRPWAPYIIRILGMEWLYRMICGGKKTFYRNVKCVSHLCFILLFDWLRQLFRRPEKTFFRFDNGIKD